MSIRFGTSGWRAVIADDFTFKNVEIVTESICRYLTERDNEEGQTLIIGNDSRFMGEKFAAVAAGIAVKNGFRVLQCTGPTPTPTISHAIRDQKAAGGMNFTASHNPPEYQGIKFSNSDGGPALPEATKRIEEIIREQSAVSGQRSDQDAGI
ncbi:MAG: phosphoglucomutase/phosphomannomutase family protein, partial [Pyrinomonadaceae bacterium]